MRQPASSPAYAGKGQDQTAPAAAKESPKVFTGGDQGFISLALDKTEDINHNTKRFRFKFDDSEAVSGLTIASALVTKFKGEEDKKPTIKPYTPVSDERKCDVQCSALLASADIE